MSPIPHSPAQICRPQRFYGADETSRHPDQHTLSANPSIPGVHRYFTWPATGDRECRLAGSHAAPVPHPDRRAGGHGRAGSPEIFKELISSTRTKINNETLARLISGQTQESGQDPFSDSDWEAIAALACTQGVGPLLYHGLSRTGKLLSLPGTAQNGLRGAYANTWAVNRQIFLDLDALANRLAQVDIPIIVLKGACFAKTIYADIAMRPMGDLDVLIPVDRFNEAVEIAKDLGYREVYPEASIGLTKLLNHEICLKKAGKNSIPLELHHALVADRSFTYAVPVEWFWEQSEPLTKLSSENQAPLRMLTPTAQVLYASAHAVLQHGQRKALLIWYYDLDLIIRSYASKMDWELLVSQARKFDWGSAVDKALAQTRAYFQTPIPESALNGLAGQTDRHSALIDRKRTPPATHILEEWQKLKSLNFYARFRLLGALIAPRPAYMLWRYQIKSSWLLPFYYMYRSWSIFKDAIATALYLMKRNIS